MTIKQGLSFEYINPSLLNHVGGIAIYYKTSKHKFTNAFPLALDAQKQESLIYLLNDWVGPSIEQIIDEIIKQDSHGAVIP